MVEVDREPYKPDLRYIDPAILAGGTDYRNADMYSVGVLLFYLLTGKYPFDPETTENQALTVPSFVSSEASRLLHCLLNPEPAKRPSAVEALEEADFITKHEKPLLKGWRKNSNSSVFYYMHTVYDYLEQSKESSGSGSE